MLGSKCPCGIYAVREPQDAAGYVANFADMGVPRAIGTVSLWGRVVEGEHGWRAEFAYPRRVYLLRSVVRVAHDLRTGRQRTPVSQVERPERLTDRIESRYHVPAIALPGGTPADVIAQLWDASAA